MGARFFGNPYFPSIDSLFVLVTCRLGAAVERLPLLSVFCLVVAVDGWVLRRVRAREFVPHSAELLGAGVAAGVVLGSAVIVGWFVPFRVHPVFVMLCRLLLLFALSRAVANDHVIRWSSAAAGVGWRGRAGWLRGPPVGHSHQVASSSGLLPRLNRDRGARRPERLQ